MFGTHKNVPARANPVCCCTQTLPPERSEARGYEPKWHFASSPSTGGLLWRHAAPPSWVAKKCRLSVTHVWLFWWKGGARIICQKRIMLIQTFRRLIQVSALRHDFTDSIARDSEPGSGRVLPFHTMIDLATCCWSSSICVAWDSEKETRS